ncbi:TRAP transporter TatT component family protein [Pseudomonadota bacterium]
MKQLLNPALILSCLLCLGGCSIKQIAISKMGDSLAESGSVYASDDDIELVGAALPFSLKTIEGLLVEVPEHKGLLITAASGFTQYSYVYVDLEALELEPAHPDRAAELKLRAKKLYLRGRSYALRAVELTQSHFIKELRRDPDATLSGFTEKNIPELYWLSLSWAAAIAADKSDMGMVADLNLIEPIMQRCLELDESYDKGALHEFMISYQGGRSPMQGGGPALAREHFARARELSGDIRVNSLVSLADSVSIGEQNRGEFELLLQQALDFNVDVYPQTRLANLVSQKRARLLLSRSDSYFLED